MVLVALQPVLIDAPSSWCRAEQVIESRKPEEDRRVVADGDVGDLLGHGVIEVYALLIPALNEVRVPRVLLVFIRYPGYDHSCRGDVSLLFRAWLTALLCYLYIAG